MQCADGHHLAIALIAITLLFALILIAVAEFTKNNRGGGTDPFLRGWVRGAIILKPSVAFCLRRF